MSRPILLVEGVSKAYQIGGAALAIRTIRGLGVPVNHVAIVDLARFPDLIDSVGGVNIDVPRPILSSRTIGVPPTRSSTVGNARAIRPEAYSPGILVGRGR